MLQGFRRRKIHSSRSVGKLFKQTREKKGISLIQAEQATNIRLKYLQAIENDNPRDFSAEVYFFGFLRRYGDYLGLNGNELVKRHQADLLPFSPRQKYPFSVGSSKHSPLPTLVFSPQMMLSMAVGILVLGLLGYIWFQVKSFAAAPDLEIKNPATEVTVSLDSIFVEGKTDSGASLFINNESVGVDKEGYFREEVRLGEGLNTMEITARNKAGKETKKTIQILAKY